MTRPPGALDSAIRDDHGAPTRFFLARWVVGLFAIGLVGGSIGLAFGIPDLLQDLGDAPARTILTVAFVAITIGGLLVVPTAYFLVRRVLGVPAITVDPRGVVLGGSWSRDLAVEWSNVRRIRLREVSSNGIRDTQVLFDLVDDAPLRARARGLRRRATLLANRLMFGVPFGLSTAYVGGSSAAVLAAIGRHYSGSVVPA